jgi:chromosome segregation ATPase
MIEEIENKIKQLVKQYAAAQKQYNGDSQKSKDIEAEIDSLEIRLKLLKEED